MTLRTGLTLLAAASLTIAACGSGDGNTEEEKATEAAEAAQSATADNSETMMDKAKDVAEKAKEEAAAVMERVQLDTSSLDAFKESLGKMKDSVSAEDKEKLMDALGKLAKGAMEEGGGLAGAAKDMMDGKSMEEGLFEKLGDKLNGLDLDGILALANQ